MKKALLFLLLFTLIPTAYGSCPETAKEIIPHITNYIDIEVNQNDNVVDFIPFGKQSFSIVPETDESKFLSKEKELEIEAFKQLGFDLTKIKPEPFKVNFEFLLRPGQQNMLIIPFIGMRVKVEKETLIYGCADWDETKLETSSIKLFFLHTSDFQRFYGRPVPITVKASTTELYLYPVSGLISIFEKISFKLFKRKLFLSVASKLIRKVENALYALQRMFFSTGVSEVELTKDKLLVTAKVGILLKAFNFNLATLNQDLKEEWWRKILKKQNIFATVEDSDIGELFLNDERKEHSK